MESNFILVSGYWEEVLESDTSSVIAQEKAKKMVEENSSTITIMCVDKDRKIVYPRYFVYPSENGAVCQLLPIIAKCC